MDVVDGVRTFMATRLRVAGADTIEADYPLVARGAIDSIELMEIILFVEEAFGVKIEDTEIVPQNLGTLAAIEKLVNRKLDARQHVSAAPAVPDL